MAGNDPYWKLRPLPPTPIEDLCRCANSPPILLRSILGANPLACAVCGREVPPERIGFTEDVSESIASWASFHDCFYRLWLDSAEFESWAFAELTNPTSPVNCRGLEVRAELDKYRRSYFWWFQDPGAEGFERLVECPRCASTLEDLQLRGEVCEACGILIAN